MSILKKIFAGNLDCSSAVWGYVEAPHSRNPLRVQIALLVGDTNTRVFLTPWVLPVPSDITKGAHTLELAFNNVWQAVHPCGVTPMPGAERYLVSPSFGATNLPVPLQWDPEGVSDLRDHLLEIVNSDRINWELVWGNRAGINEYYFGLKGNHYKKYVESATKLVIIGRYFQYRAPVSIGEKVVHITFRYTQELRMLEGEVVGGSYAFQGISGL